MTRIIWDANAERLYETGVSRGVLYLKDATGAYPKGEGWNGLSQVSEAPDGAAATAKYANNNKYANLISQENFKGTIQAYTYPDGWKKCDGSSTIVPGVYLGQQDRATFGLTWRTEIGNDVEGTMFGYKLNLAYEGVASPSKRDSASVNDTPDMISFSWDFTTTPLAIPGKDAITNKPYRPSAHIVIDSTIVDATKLAALEDILYGKDGATGTGTDPRLPLPAEVFTLMGLGTTKP